MQAQLCQVIATEIKKKQWPESLSEDIEELTSLISQYRFVEVREVVVRLKKALET